MGKFGELSPILDALKAVSAEDTQQLSQLIDEYLEQNCEGAQRAAMKQLLMQEYISTKLDDLEKRIETTQKKIGPTFNSYYFKKKPASIHVPPGSFVLRVTEFVCSKKIHEHVFLQAIRDMQEEYFAALTENRKEKARLVLIRSYFSLATTVILQLFGSMLGKIIKTVWPS